MSRLIKILLFVFVLVLIFLIGLSLFGPQGDIGHLVNQPSNEMERARLNYSDDVQKLADEKGLPYFYFMALIVLECSGNRPAGSRFEPHVYKKLIEVRDGQREKYENIERNTIKGASDEAIRNMATSWGPFQLMGYKCVELGANIEDIRGEDSLNYGMRWIKSEYGYLLQKGQFKDAFHYHNTGRKFPKLGRSSTHDPNYVDKGLAYMAYFEKGR